MSLAHSGPLSQERTAAGSTPEQDTIVAVATAPGRGGIGIVRLSGPLALPCARRLCPLDSALEPGRIRLVDIRDPATGARIDQGVLTWFRAPRSYTGEDVVEIAAHGAPVVLELMVREAIRAGARLAEPGEFTARAFLSGRIDLVQAEAVRDLIEAQTLYQARIAAEQMGGALSRRVLPVKESLTGLIAKLEAGIDFAEDDTPVVSTTEFVTTADRMIAALSELESSFAHGRLVHTGLTLAIVGRPNVGKSSLFNRLVEQERAIVTAIPGTTRDPVTERVSFAGIPVELVDTAGLRVAADQAEELGIQKSREALAAADLVLFVMDATTSLEPTEEELLASLSDRPHFLVANKADLLETPTAEPGPHTPSVLTSATTGDGIAELRAKIADYLRAPASSGSGGMLTSLRHHLAVTNALNGVEAARSAALDHIPDEMLLIDLYAALRELDALTGATTPDEILKLIFSTFCIGK